MKILIRIGLEVGLGCLPEVVGVAEALENAVVGGRSSSSVQVSLGTELSDAVDEVSSSVQVSLGGPSVDGVQVPLALGRVVESVVSGVDDAPLLVTAEVGKLPVSEGPTVVEDGKLAESVDCSPGTVEDEGAELIVDSVPG
jgi:hypothetical protein